MIVKKIGKFLIFVLPMLVVSAVPAFAETLDEALASAYQNSKLLEALRAELRSTDEDVALATAAMRPSIDLTTSATGNLSNSFDASRSSTGGSATADISLQLSMVLFDGGAGKLNREANKFAILAKRQSLIDAEQNVLMGAAEAYLNYLRFQESLELEVNNLRLIEKELDAARDRFALGDIPRTDVSIVEARLASIRSSVAQRKGQLEIARESYKLATGDYPKNLAPMVSSPELPKSLDEALANAREYHPTIQQSKHLVDQARVSLTAAEAVASPVVRLQGSVGTTKNIESWRDGSRSARISVTASLPIYHGGQKIAQYRKIVELGNQARFNLLHQSSVISQGVARSWADLQIKDAIISASGQQIASAQTAYNGIREEAFLGLRTTLDVLDAEQELRVAKNNLVLAQKDREIAVYRLLQSMGKLTARHLGLEVDIYDPEENAKRVESAPVADERRAILNKILKRSGK